MNVRKLTSGDRLIVALDFTELAQAMRMAQRLRGLIRTVKIGSALFTACGPAAIQRMRAMGFEVMLDLKFLDIPSTVELSCRAAAAHRVSLLTVHASGEPQMLQAAAAGAAAGAKRARATRPLVLGVTVLTSTVSNRAKVVTARVLALAQQAVEAGCDGVIASAQEAAALRRRLGDAPRIVCPGIRPAGAARGDQHRVATPAEAIAAGADVLIVGRPVTEAADPQAAAQQILNEMEAVQPW